MILLPPRSTLFPYTTLFRSVPPVTSASIIVSTPLRPARSGGGPRRGAPRLRSACRYSLDRKSTRLNSSHTVISYAVFCLKKKKKTQNILQTQSYDNEQKAE